MTALQLSQMQRGRFVVVDLDAAGRAASARTFTSGSCGGRSYGIIRFRTARAATSFIKEAELGVVVGRATDEVSARDRQNELLELASQAFQAANRFLDLWIGRDGTIKYRRAGTGADWKTIRPDDETEFAASVRIAARGMLRELGGSFA